MDLEMDEVYIFKAVSEDNDGNPYVKAIENVGLIPRVIPVLDFEFCNLNVLGDHLKRSSEFSGIIFTSPRAVKAVALACGSALDEGWNEHPKFVVGDATKQCLHKELGFQGLSGDADTAISLAKTILKSPAADGRLPLLFPGSELRREELPRSLAAAGVPLLQLTVYRPQPHPQLGAALAAASSAGKRPPACMAWFSPSGVRAALPELRKLLLPLHQITVGSPAGVTSVCPAGQILEECQGTNYRF